MSFVFRRLDNGVRVIIIPMSGIESVAVGVFVETGSRYETAENNGISHFLEHMVFKGTRKFPTPKDTSYLEGLGAIQNAWTDVDATAYWCKIAADKWKEGLEVVKELALNPTIPESELEIERGVILEEINRKEDRPDEISSELLMKTMFPGNSLGRPTIGEKAIIKRISRQDFLDYHANQYVAERLVVAIAGKVDATAAIKQIEEWFGGLPRDRGRKFEKIRDKQRKPEVSVQRRDLAAQVHINLGFTGVSVADPRRFALAILTAYLGRGLSSRLFVELREKRGLCYAIAADEARLTDTGIWFVYAGLNIGKLDAALKAIMEELRRVKEIKLSDEELMAAKEKNRGPILFSAENSVSVMNFYAKQVLDRPEDVMTFDQVVDRLMQINSYEVLQVARELFITKKLNLAMVGQVDENQKQKLAKILEV